MNPVPPVTRKLMLRQPSRATRNPAHEPTRIRPLGTVVAFSRTKSADGFHSGSGLSCPRLTPRTGACHQGTQLASGDRKGDMLEPAFGGEQYPFGLKVVEYRTRSPGHAFRRLYVIAALVNHTDRKLASEFPLFPERKHVVAERAILQGHLVDLRQLEPFRQFVIAGEIDAFTARV